MRVKFDYKNYQQELQISNINIFYGYNDSGKTQLAKQFTNGFTQKLKTQFLVDGAQVGKTDFEVIFIDSKENIEDHTKFTSKSIIKKIFMDKIMDTVHKESDFEDFLYEKFQKINKNLVNMLEDFNKNLKTKMNISIDIDTIEDFISNYITISFSEENLSSSSSKLDFFKTISEYSMESNNKKIIIADDFDIFFDEPTTIDFFDMIKECKNTIFILFTNKASSLTYAVGKYNIFSLRSEKIVDLTNIKKLIQYSFFKDDKETNDEKGKYTFEEYLIENKLMLLENEYKTLFDNIIKNININLGRMLVTKEYTFDIMNDIPIKIIPNSKIEKAYLQQIDTLLKQAIL